MSETDPSRPERSSAKHRLTTLGTVVTVLAVGGAAVGVAHYIGSGDQHPATHLHAAASSCSGPVGAAYVADAGWDGFTAIDTSDCDAVQTYNVGDTQVPGDSGDYNYSSTDEAVAIYGSTLYFANAGNDSVAVIDSATLDPSNYNPDETLIHVGFNPEDLAVTPNGSQLWVTDTGPQTSASSPSGISVISTATNTVTATLKVPGGPEQIAFSPSGATAYVTTQQGLYVIGTANRHVIARIAIGSPHGVLVSPDGKTVYVTDTVKNAVDVINAATDRISKTIQVGQLPWQFAQSKDGKTLYVADADSNAISVISTATDKVTGTISLSGDPDTLALTPDGSELWVGGLTSAIVTVVNTTTHAMVGSVNLGGDGANSGDGYAPTGIVLVTTPTPAGS